jgi:hypothetical protein
MGRQGGGSPPRDASMRRAAAGAAGGRCVGLGRWLLVPLASHRALLELVAAAAAWLATGWLKAGCAGLLCGRRVHMAAMLTTRGRCTASWGALLMLLGADVQ